MIEEQEEVQPTVHLHLPESPQRYQDKPQRPLSPTRSPTKAFLLNEDSPGTNIFDPSKSAKEDELLRGLSTQSTLNHTASVQRPSDCTFDQARDTNEDLLLRTTPSTEEAFGTISSPQRKHPEEEEAPFSHSNGNSPGMIPAEEIQLMRESSKQAEQINNINETQEEMTFVPEESKEDAINQIDQFEDLTDLMGREERKTMQQKKQEEEIASSGTKQITLDDFQILEEIGSGSFGVVKLVQRLQVKYALKELQKQKVIDTGKIEAVFRERDYLYKFNHPAFPKIYQTFQDEENLYFLMEHVANGSLSSLMKQQQQERLPNDLCRFYAAWLVQALEYLHEQKIVHRDLKPQNILIDDEFYLKIIDFGDSKEILNDVSPSQQFEEYNRRMNHGSEIEGSFFGGLRDSSEVGAPGFNKIREGTFVGTPLYVALYIWIYIAPEMLDGNFAGRFTDIWALGCIIYQMHVGTTPFQSTSYDQVFNRILERDLKFPKSVDKDTKDLIDKLLDYTPENRLGMQGYDEVRKHPYFKGIDFALLTQRQLSIPSKEVFGVEARTLDTFRETDAIFSASSKLGAILETTTSDGGGPSGTGSDFKHKFDECCRGKIDENEIVMEGWVKVRRKLFFYKKRQLILMEDGTVFIVKLGHISNEIKLNKYSEVALQSDQQASCRFLISNPHTYEYIECDTGEMAMTWVNLMRKIRKMVMEGAAASKQGRKSKSGAAAITGNPGSPHR